MKTFRIPASLVLAAGLLGLAACNDSGSGTDATTAQDTSTGQDTASGQDATATTFIGQLVDFKAKKGRKGVDITVLDNDTGEPVAGIAPLKSGDDGVFQLTLPPGILVGFRSTGQEEVTSGIPMKFQTTYQFNIPSDSQGKRIYAVDTITYTTAPKTAGITVDRAKGILAGTMYWTNPATREEEFVGCATVRAVPVEGGDPVGEVRYFDPNNDLPGAPSKAPFTTTGKEGTSRYIIANLTPGQQYRLEVQVDGVPFKAHIRPPTAQDPDPPEVTLFAYQDSIAISNIYLSDPAHPDRNPTPQNKPECVVDEANPY
ncbi:hypothetical protein KBD49_05635 [Myxococcota bacterium]|nr:hypothetical protein [Myxococcota bacterium]